ncbi:MAG: two-component system, OmpR family, phosphate regulon sensor histidine kinase PhoR [Chloroflexota bacterium]|nr:two-component system, OmpR family, phosphate regulon sensor histidine kinase PhoR [Chloroflexota bacterium]
MQKKTRGALDIGSIKDPELREHLQRLNASLDRQNQELKALDLKNKILDAYFQSDDLQATLDLAVETFKMPGCSSLRILAQWKSPFGIAQGMQAIEGQFAAEYAYLDDQIIQQLQDKEQLVIGDTSKIHSIKFSPEQRYPRAIGAFRFVNGEDLNGYLWVSFEAVKEFTAYELERLAQFGEVLKRVCRNAFSLRAGSDSVRIFSELLEMVDRPLVFIHAGRQVTYANACARQTFHEQYGEICEEPAIKAWLQGTQVALQAEVTLVERHYQVLGRRLANDGALLALEDDTAFERKQAYLALMMDTIHHDFRGSLVNLQGFSKLLGMVGELNDKQGEYLQWIQDGIEEIATVTTDLLDVNRMVQEGGLRVQECEPQEVVGKALALIQAEARQKQVSFDQQLTSEGQMIVVDRIMVISALYHLLKQAIQNSHLGGSVEIEEKLDGRSWIVSVHDAGRGISQIDIENLTQNHFADKNSPGLSLVYRIARFHQGDLRVESELGKGTNFILQLTSCD